MTDREQTHRNCIHFVSGFCTLKRKYVNPDEQGCNRFESRFESYITGELEETYTPYQAGIQGVDKPRFSYSNPCLGEYQRIRVGRGRRHRHRRGRRY